MIAFLDVDYRSDGARAACVLAHDWSDPIPSSTHVEHVRDVEPYEPGQFFRRELPCLLAVLRRLDAEPSTVVVDGYAWLGKDRPGLGKRLHIALDERVPVIGVAKTAFHEAPSVSVFRGGSSRALFVTAAGCDPEKAAEHIRGMAGKFRLPTLLQMTDRLCRDTLLLLV